MRTSVYIYLSPVVTIVASWLLLGDPVLPMALLGAALTLVGLVPVSYTHLDVYKRQQPACTQPSATPPTICATRSGTFLPTAT